MKHIDATGRYGWKDRLVEEAGAAARAGWAQTFRLMALLVAVAAAIALIVWVSRH